MPSKEIIPRKVLNHDQERWRIIVPKDLRKQQEGRVFLFFRDEGEANAKAKQLNQDRGRIGAGFHALNQQEQALVLEALHRAGDARQLLMAVDQLESAEKNAGPVLVSKVVEQYITAKEAAGARDKSVQNIKSSLQKFAVSVGVPTIGEVTTKHIEDWLGSNGWGSETRKTYLNHIRGLFLFAVKRRKYISESPAEVIPYPKTNGELPQIHMVDDVKRFLAMTLKHDPALLGYICPIYFNGLRPDESKRLTKDLVREKVIVVNPENTKVNARRFATITPMLKLWMDVKGFKFGNRNVRRRMQAIRDLFEERVTKKSRNGHMKTTVKYKRVDGKKVYAFPFCQDIMRHTFFSYVVPKIGKVEAAAIGGTSEEVIKRDYLERVEPDEVERFWGLTPEAIRLYINSIDNSDRQELPVTPCSPLMRSAELTTP